MEAASSMESSLVTSTPFLERPSAPTACTMVVTAGSATGTAPIKNTVIRDRIEKISRCRKIA